MEAAAQAAAETGAAVEIHTEKGAEAEHIVASMGRFGLEGGRIVLCHVDKRPDFELHRDLAQAGVMLEYDTFYRPKYRPEEGVWPLLERMLAAGCDAQVAIATDMADASMWSRLRGGPGLTGLLTDIKPRLEKLGVQTETIEGLVGINIAGRLARPHQLPP
jgi:phosphotriesterase-related protein